MKIVFLDKSHIESRYDIIDYSALNKLGTLILLDVKSPEEIIEASKDADVIITGKLALNRERPAQNL